MRLRLRVKNCGLELRFRLRLPMFRSKPIVSPVGCGANDDAPNSKRTNQMKDQATLIGLLK